ncbi:aspartate and glycine-rich protein-like [Rhineura floridana]|uniref:aspartate and glycine-rich protein-like n=1 Tax=Rhineura floridana TaxID=261503 RepID=UPI002AC7F65F|nr:aspartate and glycine-rich protein-like [Rhineura floridana]
MKVQVVAAFLVICLLSLGASPTNAANINIGGGGDPTIEGNGIGNNFQPDGEDGGDNINIGNGGSPSIGGNGIGNNFAADPGNGGSFDGNSVGDNSFNNNGNTDDDPIIYY